MRVNYSPRAQQELLVITKYYNDNVPELGIDFMSELDRQINLCRESPNIGVRVDKFRRRLVMNRFPYNIIYRHLQQEIRVIAIAHQHRKPDYWKLAKQHYDKIKETNAVYAMM